MGEQHPIATGEGTCSCIWVQTQLHYVIEIQTQIGNVELVSSDHKANGKIQVTTLKYPSLCPNG